jgi:hypothetical protein
MADVWRSNVLHMGGQGRGLGHVVLDPGVKRRAHLIEGKVTMAKVLEEDYALAKICGRKSLTFLFKENLRVTLTAPTTAD